ncbi:unnamed protein product (macronuclear) [Paramecium tetraurelia]|uniref:Uncharacterized protein n=1 Tax=Paramecium tetraurelia TaxID=5888 RepID=A0BZJ8_PARTE|nr:uncharacterized protein GSPATT00033818001 [Paramecium tetraurelia]CAK63965.1 unnamed protein product [Paramecium tetraurelia]|eukprot:XP_001431363.1 hypothetical protein (macronuclear) [Paramecium tetraurelia strain d4-2]
MNQFEYKAYEVYQGNLLIDYWAYKENDHSYPKSEMIKINKKMKKMQIKGSKRKKKEKDQMIDKIVALCI